MFFPQKQIESLYIPPQSFDEIDNFDNEDLYNIGHTGYLGI